MNRIKIFYDGVNIQKYHNKVCGFTTNTTIMKQGGELNYHNFFNKYKTLISDKPISFQIWETDEAKAIQDCYTLNSFGSNIYIKVPVIKEDGTNNLQLICKLIDLGFKINITSVFTASQLLSIYEINDKIKTPCIVSIFCGRISDTGVNPTDIMKFGITLFSKNKNVEILWAGCKDNTSILSAIEIGCHIVTLPDSIIDRIDRIEKDLEIFSKETVCSFNNDGKSLKLI